MARLGPESARFLYVRGSHSRTSERDSCFSRRGRSAGAFAGGQQTADTSLRFLLLSVFLLSQAPASSPAPVIVQINLDDVVHPVSADYIKDGLNHAKDINARAVVIRLDTPGGLIDSMRDIVEAILASPVPVITWVGPVGSRAASAGFFILESGDIAAMAPGTNTGAAHPVSGTGGQIDQD